MFTSILIKYNLTIGEGICLNVSTTWDFSVTWDHWHFISLHSGLFSFLLCFWDRAWCVAQTSLTFPYSPASIFLIPVGIILYRKDSFSFLNEHWVGRKSQCHLRPQWCVACKSSGSSSVFSSLFCVLEAEHLNMLATAKLNLRSLNFLSLLTINPKSYKGVF